VAIIVTIGRNVDGEPMPYHDWLDFQDTVLHKLFTVYEPTIYFQGTGMGDGNWGKEEAFTVIAEAPVRDDLREDIHKQLAYIGRLYNQEAVAVTEGPTEFL